MKKTILSSVCILALGITAAAQSTTDKPFKGKFYSDAVQAEIDLYAPTVTTYFSSDKGYGIIEGVYMNGNRLDTHEIVRVVSIDGNKAVVVYNCSFDGEEKPRTAVLTYNPADGTLTIENDTSTITCYQGDKLTLKSKKPGARKGVGKRGGKKRR